MFKEYDLFDVAGALYFWLQHNWSGQGDPLYSAFCELDQHYKRGGSQCFEDIPECEREIYETLTLDNYQEALTAVLAYESEAS